MFYTDAKHAETKLELQVAVLKDLLTEEVSSNNFLRGRINELSDNYNEYSTVLHKIRVALMKKDKKNSVDKYILNMLIEVLPIDADEEQLFAKKIVGDSSGECMCPKE